MPKQIMRENIAWIGLHNTLTAHSLIEQINGILDNHDLDSREVYISCYGSMLNIDKHVPETDAQYEARRQEWLDTTKEEIENAHALSGIESEECIQKCIQETIADFNREFPESPYGG